MRNTPHVELRSGAYADSVTLLQVSRDVQRIDGVIAAQVAMATPLNVEVLGQMGFDVPADATPNDMVVAIRVADDADLRAALAGVDTRAGRRGPRQRRRAERAGSAADDRSRTAPLRRRPRAGQRARTERRGRGDGRARRRPRRDDLQRQRATRPGARPQADRTRPRAAGDGSRLRYGGRRRTRSRLRQRGRTRSRWGSWPLPAPAASSCSALLDHAGVGVTSALGVGGRDLSADVRGISTRDGDDAASTRTPPSS